MFRMSSVGVAAVAVLIVVLDGAPKSYAAGPNGRVCSYAACQSVCLSKAFTGNQCSKRCTKFLQRELESGRCKSIT